MHGAVAETPAARAGYVENCVDYAEPVEASFKGALYGFFVPQIGNEKAAIRYAVGQLAAFGGLSPDDENTPSVSSSR
jgi:hypothetical protein